MAHKYKLKEIEIGDVKVDGGVKSVVTGKDPETGAISWSIDYVPNLTKLVEDSMELAATARGVYQKAKGDKKFLDIYEQSKQLRNTIRTHVRNNYPEDYKKAIFEDDIDEASGTNGDIIDLNPGNKTKLANYVKLPHHLAAALLDISDEIMGKEASTIGSQPQIKQALALLKKAAGKELTKGKEVDEMSTSGAAGAYLTPNAFKKPKKQKALESAENPGEDLGPGPKATEDGVKDNAYVKQFKYRLVPKKNGTYVQKGSGMVVKKLD